jgi:hypothetical protein
MVVPLPPREPTVLPTPSAESGQPQYVDQRRRWYGWQLLIFDGAVLSALGIGTAADIRGDAATALGFSLGLVFDVAPPIVHAVHHRGGMGWASFGVRSGLPFAVLLSTVLLSSCRDPFDNRCLNTTSANVSAFLGLAAASAIDVSLFAWDAPATRTPSQATLQWSPVFTPRPDGGSLGVVGAF